jgi:hypothetical protein
MSAEMRSFMEAYGAVHNKEVKESLDNSRDSISEMNLSQLTESDLHEAVEQVLEVWFAEGHTVSECEEIVESILVSSDIPGRQGKIERLLEAFGAVISRVKEKSARTAVESFALYRKGKQVKESWNNKFSHDNGNEKLHERLVAADLAGVKNGMLEAYKKLPLSKMALQISSKARKQGMEIGQGKQSSIKPNQQIGKMGGVMDTHNPTRSQAKEKANKAPGFSKRSKSVGEEFEGNYEGPLYAQHPDLAENKKEMLDKMNKSREGFMAQDGPNKPAYDAKQRIAAKTKAKRDELNIRGNNSAEQKARLEKKRGMNLDDHPQFKKEELEVSQIRKDWAEAYKSIYEVKGEEWRDDILDEEVRGARKGTIRAVIEKGGKSIKYVPSGGDIVAGDRAAQERASAAEKKRSGKNRANAARAEQARKKSIKNLNAKPGEDTQNYGNADYGHNTPSRYDKSPGGPSGDSHYSLKHSNRAARKRREKGLDEAKKGDGNLANNYPPYDKVTRGDIIAGAKGEDQMGGKKKKKVTEGSCEGMCKKCGKDPCECPKDEMKEASNWIKGAIKKPGALHKQLGVPEGEKIPEAKLRAAARRSGKIGQRARLALTLKGLKKEDTDWEFLDNLIESEKFTEEQIEKIAKDL